MSVYDEAANGIYEPLTPQRAAWAGALSDISNLFAGQASQGRAVSMPMQARRQREEQLRYNQGMKRQTEQDAINERLRQSQIAKNIGYGGSLGGKIGTVNPRDFTKDSVAAYQQTGNIGDLVRYKPQVIDVGGIPHRENQETGRFEPIVDQRSPEYVAQIEQQVKLKQEEQSKMDFTKSQSKWQAGEVNYLNNISNSEQKLGVINDTADEIRGVIGGWSTGGGGLLKDLPGTDARKLAGLLDTIKANSAFTTLADLKAAGGTLGAISEAELNLLERAWGALDQGGDPQELLRVLDQLVGQNSGSLQRLRYGYDENKKRYGTNLTNDATLPMAAPQGNERKSLDDLLKGAGY